MQIYIHFTDLEGARAINKTQELWASSFVDAVFAVAKGGSLSTGVQLTSLGRPKNRKVAVYFTTNVLPDVCYPEECLWRTDKIPIHVVAVKLASKAILDLDGSLPVKDEGETTERLLIPSKEGLIKEFVMQQTLLCF